MGAGGVYTLPHFTAIEESAMVTQRGCDFPFIRTFNALPCPLVHLFNLVFINVREDKPNLTKSISKLSMC